MANPQIFEFKDIYAYLAQLKNEFKGRKRPLTYGQLAKLMGYESPRTVAMAWTGKRPLSKNILSRIRVMANLNPKQYLYLELLAANQKNQNAGSSRELAALSKGYKKKSIENRIFRLISNWEHAVLQQLLQGQKKLSSELLQQKLRGDTSPQMISQAIENLLSLGLLKYDEKNDQFVETLENLVAGQDIPSKAIASHHEQNLELAMKALKEQLTRDRDFNGHTLRFNPSHMEEAREFIYSFIQEFNDKFFSHAHTEVYQLNVQLFSHTKPEVDLKK